MKTIRELNRMSFEELQELYQKNEEAMLAFEKAGLGESIYYKKVVDEKKQIEHFLNLKREEDNNSSIANALNDYIYRVINDKQISIYNDEELIITIKVSKNEDDHLALKSEIKRRKKSQQQATTRSPRANGYLMILNDGTELSNSSAVELLRELKHRQIVPDHHGNGDSAVRVLESLTKKRVIRNFQKL